MSLSQRVSLISLTLATVFADTPAIASDLLDPAGTNVPVVLTPTRLRQSLSDVPASVTIITADMIAKYGIRNLPEALRLVPGMAVTQVTGNDYRVNFHGTNILVPRRMNVLVDGMSIYRPAFARVDWTEIPVAIEDIERIEVTRGPNSAAYGSNSMMAIVNVISKSPKDVAGTTLGATIGSLETRAGFARHGGQIGDTNYRFSVSRRGDAGYDYANSMGRGHDDSRLTRLNFRSTTDLSPTEAVDLQLVALNSHRAVEFIDRFQITNPDIAQREFFASARWSKALSPTHDVQVHAYMNVHDVEQPWRTCMPTAFILPQMHELWKSNPAYVNALLANRIPSGGTARDNQLAAAALAAFRALGPRAAVPTCLDADQDYVERRYDVELQDTYVFSDKLRVVGGAGVRRDVGSSQTFLNGKVSNNTWRAFANAEYKPSTAYSINVGGFYEHADLDGTAFSPRIAINTHLTPNHTLRTIVSQSTRTPDIQEQKANWSYRVRNLSPAINGLTESFYYQSAVSPGGLREERNLAKEVSLLSNFPEYGLLVETKYFHNRLSSLVSEKLSLGSFAPTNRNEAVLEGAELQMSYEPSDRWSAHFAYAYLNNRASTVEERTQYARHSGAVAVSHLLENNWRVGFAVYQYGASVNGQTPYGREDLTFSKVYRLGKGYSITPSFTVSHLDNRSSTFQVDAGQQRVSRFDDAMQYFATVRVDF